MSYLKNSPLFTYINDFLDRLEVWLIAQSAFLFRQ